MESDDKVFKELVGTIIGFLIIAAIVLGIFLA